MTRNSLIAWLFAAIAAVAFVAAPSPAHADEQRAVEIYEEATAAYQNGDLQKAADLLDQAFAEHPDLVYKYNRILALQGLGQHEKALSELNALYAPMKADPDDRFSDIDEIKSELEAAIAKKESEEKPDEPAETSEETDTTNDGSTTTDVETSETTTPDESSGGPNIAAIALIGGGVALLGTGIVFSTGVLLGDDVLACSKDGDCQDLAARDYSGDVGVARDDANSIRTTHQIVALSLIGGGVVVGAIGAVLLVLDGGDSGGDATATATGLDSLRVAPLIGANAGGATLQLRF